MQTKTEEINTSWSYLQVPVCISKYPNAYLRLLAALENGWYIQQTDLVPSWDQNGFVFKITIRQNLSGNLEELIIPRSSALEDLIEKNSYMMCEY
jgi:hypothetical protein